MKGVSLIAKPGEVTALMGRNGVGKTSLIRGVGGRIPLSAGRIRLGGREIHKMRPDQRARAGVATVPQGREIFPLLSVQENLETAFPKLPRADRFVPEEVFELFPVLREMLGRRGGDLSGGQQQQLAIGRAMTTRPRLLLLDEPTEGIQPSIIKDIGRAIGHLRARGDIAILLVEQYFEFARDLADQFYVMDRGEIVMGGRAAEMVEADVRRWLTV
ncbi:MAG: urea ABC transporter ATP-binding subunit UrtE [Pseudomonadota bacterium]